MSICKCMGCMADYEMESNEVCPYCGYERDAEKAESFHLDPGTIIEDRYIIGKVLGAGGFGITYIAWDSNLNHRVAIKEYLPSDMATRIPETNEVCPYDGSGKAEQFKEGLKRFIDEALRLVSLNHLEGIVRMFDCVVSNCTAYIVMEYVEGQTLKEMLQKNGPMPYGQLLDIMIPVLSSLEKLHKEGIVHRDIAPDNIIKTYDGKIKLIDFGAARNTSDDASISIMLKPGYAPPEQYLVKGHQGPWTDIYAIGAVMYHSITGKRPADSVDRQKKDTLKTPTKLGYPLPQAVEEIIMKALNVKIEDRVSSCAEMAEIFSKDAAARKLRESDEMKAKGRMGKKTKILIAISAVVAAILIGAIAFATTTVQKVSVDERDLFPDLMGLTKEEAIEKLENSPFEDVELVCDGDDNGVIIYQSITKGAKLSDDTKEVEVRFDGVFKDNMAIPEILKLSEKNAMKELEEAGFDNVEVKTKITTEEKDGKIFKVKPEIGTIVNRHNKVTVYVAKKPVETTKATQAPAPTPAPTQATTKAPVQSYEDNADGWQDYAPDAGSDDGWQDFEPDAPADEGWQDFEPDAGSDEGWQDFE